MTEERGALIEAMARALWASATIAGKWESLSDTARDPYRIDADVALTAISNAGYAVVPVEPSEAMEEAARDVPFIAMGNGEYADPDRIDIYRAMIEAGRVK